MPSDQEILARAKEYPYEAAAGSFLLVDGEVEALELHTAETPADGGHAVLAYASNASPTALRRKAALPDFPARPPIPFLRARLRDFDVVFSAHLSPYGAVPATLRRSPGTTSPAFLMFPSEEQLTALRETEPNYELVELPPGAVVIEGPAAVCRAQAFVSRHGCLEVEGSAVALRAVPSTRRRLAAMSEVEALVLAADRLGEGTDLDGFILATAGDAHRAAARTRELRRTAIPMRELPAGAE